MYYQLTTLLYFSYFIKRHKKILACDTPSVRAGAAVAISKAKAVETKFGFKADSEEGKSLLVAVSKMLSENLPKKQRYVQN